MWRACDGRAAPAKRNAPPTRDGACGHPGRTWAPGGRGQQEQRVQGLGARRELCGSARRACQGRASALTRRGASARQCMRVHGEAHEGQLQQAGGRFLELSGLANTARTLPTAARGYYSIAGLDSSLPCCDRKSGTVVRVRNIIYPSAADETPRRRRHARRHCAPESGGRPTTVASHALLAAASAQPTASRGRHRCAQPLVARRPRRRPCCDLPHLALPVGCAPRAQGAEHPRRRGDVQHNGHVLRLLHYRARLSRVVRRRGRGDRRHRCGPAVRWL